MKRYLRKYSKNCKTVSIETLKILPVVIWGKQMEAFVPDLRNIHESHKVPTN